MQNLIKTNNAPTKELFYICETYETTQASRTTWDIAVEIEFSSFLKKFDLVEAFSFRII